MQVKFKKLNSNAKLPVKANPGDACYDVWATEIEVNDSYIKYKLGFAVEIPEGWEIKIFPRSSISKKDLVLCNSVGTVDAPYRGEVEVRFKVTLPVDVIMHIGNPEMDQVMSSKYKGWVPKIYDLNEAVAQISIQPIHEIEWVESNELTETERGEGGFGSSTLKSVNPEIKDGDGS
jgi:dUTP pyrophosphatase